MPNRRNDMLQVYKKINKAIVTVDPELIVDGYDFSGQWIHMSNPTDKEIELVASSTAVPEDFIKAALDEEERARVEKEDDILLALTDIPITEDDDDHYTYATLPFGFISTNDVVITVCINETSIIYDLMTGRFIKDFNIHKRTRFLLQLEYAISKKYLQYLKQINRASQRVQSVLEKSMQNEELIEMLDLEKSLVYFSTSLRANTVVLDKLPKLVKFFEEDEDLWEDVLIENRQAIEMSNIYRDILNGTMDAYASIISNNLNGVMKILTSLTLIVAIPSMIGSFWGMNTGVPFESQPWGFWVVIGISVVICIAITIVLWKKRMLK